MALTAGQPWQDQQWLAHLASYGLYDLGGLPLVYLADAACLLGALAIAIRAARVSAAPRCGSRRSRAR